MRGRIRTVKPELFDDEELWDLAQATGLPVLQAFVGLWCYADREGRFEWRLRALRSKILPYWDGDMGAVLEALASKSFIVRYTVDGKDYGQVRTFRDHQVINQREAASELPGPSEHAHVHARARTAEVTEAPVRAHGEGKGREGKGRELEGKGTARAAPVVDSTGESLVIREIPPAFELDDELRAEAITAGCDPARLDERMRDLRLGPIGGRRGVFQRDLRDFIRGQFGRWKMWDETDRAKARAGPRGRPDPVRALAERVEMLRAEEAEEERRGAKGVR